MILWVILLTVFLTLINVSLIAWTAGRRYLVGVRRLQVDDRVTHWRPILENWLWDPEAEPPPEPVTEADREAVEEVLLPFLELLRGSDKIRVAFFLAQSGYLSRRLLDLQSPRWWVRAKAATALGLIGLVESCRSLEPLLEDRHPLVRQTAIRALGRLAHPESLAPLLKAIERHDPHCREYLVGALRALGSAAIPSQRAILERPGSSEAHRVAARVLRDVADPSVARALAIAVTRNQDAELALLALESLVEVGGADPDEAEHAALIALQSPVIGIRQLAVKVLGRWGTEKALLHVVAALYDEAWGVRRAAAAALHAFGPPAFPHLCEGLKHLQAAEVIMEEAQISGLLEDVLALLDKQESAWPLAEALCRQIDAVSVRESLAKVSLSPETRARLAHALPEETFA